MEKNKIQINMEYNPNKRSDRKAKAAVVCTAILLGLGVIVFCVYFVVPSLLAGLINIFG